MAIRTVKQYTDRGSIKDLTTKVADEQSKLECPDLPSIVRLKKLYEYAQLNKDNNLQSSLGFITTDYIADKNALPLSIYRIRRIVDDIKSKTPGKIEQLQEQFSHCFAPVASPEAQAYFNKNAMIKTASIRKPPVFRRVSRI